MKKRILVIGGIVVLVVLLAGAAFVAGRLITGQGLPGQVSSGGLQMTLGGPGGKVPIQFDEQPAKELPQTPADVRGAFDHRKDNSIFVGTGKVTLTAQKDQAGNVQTSSSHSGPTVEVVVTTQTIVYKDMTLQQYNGQPPPNGKVQQVVEPGNLDDIGTSSLVTAWGKKTGDRVIADVLVYTPPPVMIKRP